MISDLTRKKSVAISSLVVGSMLCVLAGVGISGAIDHYYGTGKIVPVASNAWVVSGARAETRAPLSAKSARAPIKRLGCPGWP